MQYTNFQEDLNKNKVTMIVITLYYFLVARDILHVHCARRGRASTSRLGTLIVLLTGTMPTNFHEDWNKNKVTMIAL